VFIYPILLVGAAGLLLVLERTIYLARARTPAKLADRVLDRLSLGQPAAASELLAGSRTPAARVFRAAVETVGRPDEQRQAAVESALLAEAPRLERSLSLLAALAGVAPLLGLLGTVSGMISTFDTIAAAGTGNPRLLSGGISEALLTTQLGLMVAIPLLLAHAGLTRWIERREAMLEHDAIRVLGLGEGPPAATGEGGRP
jgi:biopolymer transport protein ExbB